MRRTRETTIHSGKTRFFPTGRRGLRKRRREKIVSAEQSQQSLAGPGKWKDFAKPPEASRGRDAFLHKARDFDKE